ncbi:MAG: hypothetical protein JWN67_682 [Actinomycetia bacterium]|nr:hypothetical protein [Actinomycetes bacterium]
MVVGVLRSYGRPVTGLRRRPVSIAVLDPSEVGAAVVAALAPDERVVVRHVVPCAGAGAALGELLACRTDIVVLEAEASFGEGWSADQLVAPLLACGAEVVVRGSGRGPSVPDRRQEVVVDASVSSIVDVVRSRYPELRGRPGPPDASAR